MLDLDWVLSSHVGLLGCEELLDVMWSLLFRSCLTACKYLRAIKPFTMCYDFSCSCYTLNLLLQFRLVLAVLQGSSSEDVKFTVPASMKQPPNPKPNPQPLTARLRFSRRCSRGSNLRYIYMRDVLKCRAYLQQQDFGSTFPYAHDVKTRWTIWEASKGGMKVGRIKDPV